MTLRELRMWHWKQCLDYRRCAKAIREAAEDKRCSRHTRAAKLADADSHDRIADHHMKAVQCLNDFLTGTAEQDCHRVKVEASYGVAANRPNEAFAYANKVVAEKLAPAFAISDGGAS